MSSCKAETSSEARPSHAGLSSVNSYDRWRYNYPRYDTSQKWGKVPSQELSNALTAAFKDKLDTD